MITDDAKFECVHDAILRREEDECASVIGQGARALDEGNFLTERRGRRHPEHEGARANVDDEKTAGARHDHDGAATGLLHCR